MRKTVSFEVQGWGHALGTWHTSDGGLTVRCVGHSRERFQKNDFIVLKDSRYLVKKVEFLFDPHDMFKADLVFWPRIPVGIKVRVVKENDFVARGAVGVTAPEQESLSAIYVEFPELGIIGFPSVEYVEEVDDEN